MRNQYGQPIGKQFKQTFVPASKAESKQNIKNDAFTIHENHYEAARHKQIEDHVQHKANIIGGEFMCSKAFDNNMGPDWTKKTQKERTVGMMKNAGLKRNTLANTADVFIAGGNRYDTQLKDFDEMPRLSILNNYKRIKQIMNTSYVKGFSIEHKYRNRTKQDSD